MQVFHSAEIIKSVNNEISQFLRTPSPARSELSHGLDSLVKSITETTTTLTHITGEAQAKGQELQSALTFKDAKLKHTPPKDGALQVRELPKTPEPDQLEQIFAAAVIHFNNSTKPGDLGQQLTEDQQLAAVQLAQSRLEPTAGDLDTHLLVRDVCNTKISIQENIKFLKATNDLLTHLRDTLPLEPGQTYWASFPRTKVLPPVNERLLVDDSTNQKTYSIHTSEQPIHPNLPLLQLEGIPDLKRPLIDKSRYLIGVLGFVSQDDLAEAFATSAPGNYAADSLKNLGIHLKGLEKSIYDLMPLLQKHMPITAQHMEQTSRFFASFQKPPQPNELTQDPALQKLINQ